MVFGPIRQHPHQIIEAQTGFGRNRMTFVNIRQISLEGDLDALAGQPAED